MRATPPPPPPPADEQDQETPEQRPSYIRRSQAMREDQATQPLDDNPKLFAQPWYIVIGIGGVLLVLVILGLVATIFLIVRFYRYASGRAR